MLSLNISSGGSSSSSNASRTPGQGPNATQVLDWVAEHVLTPPEVDCATAVMLKVLDGKCKMPDVEKVIMTHLYLAVRQQKGIHLGQPIHRRIAKALSWKAQHGRLDEEIRDQIYETRVLAETAISRPVMKRFKARLREQGLLPVRKPADQQGVDHADS